MSGQWVHHAMVVPTGTTFLKIVWKSIICLSVHPSMPVCLFSVFQSIFLLVCYLHKHLPPLFLVPPELIGPSGQYLVMEGSPSMNFIYTVNPSSLYSLSWKLNGSNFEGNSRISLLNDSKTLVLQFPSRVDSGIYTVTAGNRAGSISLNLELKVTCTCMTL